MNDPKNRKKQGFSLIEIMVAALILSVVLLSAGHLMMQTSVTVQQQQLKREAIVSATTVMERYWNMNYEDLLSYVGSPESSSINVTGIVLDYEVTFTEVTDAEGQDCVEIVTRVYRTDFVEDILVSARRYRYGLSQAAIQNN